MKNILVIMSSPDGGGCKFIEDLSKLNANQEEKDIRDAIEFAINNPMKNKTFGDVQVSYGELMNDYGYGIYNTIGDPNTGNTTLPYTVEHIIFNRVFM